MVSIGIRVKLVVLFIDSRSVVWVWTKLVLKARFRGGRTSTKPMLGVMGGGNSPVFDIGIVDCFGLPILRSLLS